MRFPSGAMASVDSNLHGRDVSRSLAGGIDTVDSGSASRSSRPEVFPPRLAAILVSSYIGLVAATALASGSLPDETRAAIVVMGGAPLLMGGWYLAARAAARVHGPIRRFWRHVASGNAFLAAGFLFWGFLLVSWFRLFGALALASSIAAAVFYMAAVASRIRLIEGSSSAGANVASTAAVVCTALAVYSYVFAPGIVPRRGLGPALFVGVVLGGTSGLGYLLYLLLSKHREFARPPDQLIALSTLLSSATAMLNAAYLLTDRPTENIAIGVAALVSLAPAVAAPAAESGRFLRHRPSRSYATARFVPVAAGWTTYLGLAIYHLIARPAAEDFRVSVLLSTGTTLGAASLVLLRALSRSEQVALRQQAAVELLYEQEAAKEAALLDILQRVSEGWSLKGIVESALDAVLEATRAERALFLVVDPARQRVDILGFKGLSLEEVEDLKATIKDPYALLREFRGGRSVVTANTPIPGLSDSSARFGDRAFAAVAISGWEEGGTAELCADVTSADVRFTEDDIQLMEAVADYVNLALSRVRLFRELASSEERYRLLVEESPDGVVELDEEGRVLFANSAFAGMLGSTPVQLLGRRIDELIPDLDWARPSADSVTRTTAAYQGASGEIFLEIYQSLRKDGNVLALVRDVTERHRYAQHIRHLYEQLAEKERLRTKALSKLIKTEEETRSRIAADLHDGPIQELSRLAIALDLSRKHLEQGRLGDALDVLTEVRRSLSTEVLKMRGLMTELRPPVLEERGIADALEDYARSFENETGIKVSLQVRGAPALDKSRELTLYRIFQEAMTNVKKHSFAREVTISLDAFEETGVVLTISDDGIGFDPGTISEAVRGGHIGVVSMMERAELAGGSCRIHGAPGQGTTVRVTLGTKVDDDAGTSTRGR